MVLTPGAVAAGVMVSAPGRAADTTTTWATVPGDDTGGRGRPRDGFGVDVRVEAMPTRPATRPATESPLE